MQALKNIDHAPFVASALSPILFLKVLIISLPRLHVLMSPRVLHAHPLETLNGVRGVHEVSNTLAWLAEEVTSRNEIMIL